MNPNNSLFEFDLVYALQNSDKWKSMPPNAQAAILQKARQFQDHYGSHFLSPDELAESLGGSPATWRQFLTLKPVRDYIQQKTNEDVEIMHRAAVAKQAIKAVKSGETQAAKFIKELHELNNEQNGQTVVVLHYIPRPQLGDNETTTD